MRMLRDSILLPVRRLGDSRGAALLYVILSTIIIAAISVGVALITSSTLQTNLADNSHQEAYYAAQSGYNYLNSLYSAEFEKILTETNFNINTKIKFKVYIKDISGSSPRSYNVAILGIANAGTQYEAYYLLGTLNGTTPGSGVPPITPPNPPSTSPPPKGGGKSKVIIAGYEVGDSLGDSITIQGGSTIKGNLTSLSNTTALVLQGGVNWTGTSQCSNDGITISGGSSANGNLNAHGDVLIDGGSVVTGNIYASGNVTIQGNSTVKGDVNSGGSVYLAGTIKGSVYLSGSYSQEGWSTLTGDIYSNPKAPSDCSSFTLPDHEVYYSTTDLNVSGNYTFKGSGIDDKTNKFRSITFNGGSKLCFDLSTPNTYINIFVTGNVNFGGGVNVYVKTQNGNCFTSANQVSDIDFINSSYASKIYMDVNGNTTFNGGSNWIGTIYATGNIQPGGGTSVIGGLYSSAGDINPYNAWYYFSSVDSTYFLSRLQ